MIYILLSILSSTGIFVIFKRINSLQLDIAPIITINYLVASAIGMVLSPYNPSDVIHENWLPWAFIIGVLFIIFFFIIGISSKIAGIAITTVASKMSVIIPILFSILYFNEVLTSAKSIGILLALAGVFLTVYRKNKKDKNQGIWPILLPLILFVGMGMIDSLIKYTQATYISNDKSAYFTSSLFAVSFFSGLFYTLPKKQYRPQYTKIKIWVWGLVLGFVNYGSIYFLINALNSNFADSSIVFGINNVGIVVLSVLTGILIFKEKITLINSIGILSSIIAIATLSLA
ncbi:MAG: hypothetical protein JXR60_03790 [Bacteroidales bacterium]|nr:hypothetical protein [Bacteroidales bacterium]